MAGQGSDGARRGSGKQARNQVVRATPTAPPGNARTRGGATAVGGVNGKSRSAGSKGGSGRAGAAASGAAARGAAAGSGPASRSAGPPGGRGQAGPATARAARSAGPSATAADQPQPGSGQGLLAAIWTPVRSLGAVRLIVWVLSLFGLGVSTWLTITHFDTSITLSCPDTGIVNCAKVTTSSESEVFGVIPVAVLGLAFYLFMAVANSPWFWAWTSRWEPGLRRWSRRIRLGSVAVGMCFVLYLVFAELILIGNICLWCTSVHVTTFLIFALLVFYTAFSGSPDDYPASMKA